MNKTERRTQNNNINNNISNNNCNFHYRCYYSEILATNQNNYNNSNYFISNNKITSKNISNLLELIIFIIILSSSSVAGQTCTPVLRYFPLSCGLSFPYFIQSGKNMTSNNTGITKVIISMHGTSRDADSSFCSMFNSAKNYSTFTKGAFNMSNVFVIAPFFCIEEDRNITNGTNTTIYWDDNSDWKDGTNSTLRWPQKATSFEILDQLLNYVVTSRNFPSLTTIVIAGHSAGGQLLQRYAMVSTKIETLESYNIKLKFYVANPSSYVYMTALRAQQLSNYTCNNYCDNITDIMNTNNNTVNWITPSTTCKYNNWKYGFSGTLSPYMKQTVSQMKTQYLRRNVTYLAGTADTCNESFGTPYCKVTCDSSTIDLDCEANFQGNCRLKRAYNYLAHVVHVSGGIHNHKIVPIPGVGHSASKMWIAREAQVQFFS